MRIPYVIDGIITFNRNPILPAVVENKKFQQVQFLCERVNF